MATARTVTASDFLADVELELKNTETIVPKDTELFPYLNKAYEILWNGILIPDESDLIRSANVTQSTADGTETYALASFSTDATDLVSVHRIYVADATDNYSPMDLCDETDRYDYILGSAATQAAAEARPTKYYLSGTNIGLLPVPDAIYTVNMTYYPNWTPLASLATNMPLRNLFNPALKEAVLFTAKNRDLSPSQLHFELQKMFERMAVNILGMRRPNHILQRPRYR